MSLYAPSSSPHALTQWIISGFPTLSARHAWRINNSCCNFMSAPRSRSMPHSPMATMRLSAATVSTIGHNFAASALRHGCTPVLKRPVAGSGNASGSILIMASGPASGLWVCVSVRFMARGHNRCLPTDGSAVFGVWQATSRAAGRDGAKLPVRMRCMWA